MGCVQSKEAPVPSSIHLNIGNANFGQNHGVINQNVFFQSYLGDGAILEESPETHPLLRGMPSQAGTYCFLPAHFSSQPACNETGGKYQSIQTSSGDDNEKYTSYLECSDAIDTQDVEPISRHADSPLFRAGNSELDFPSLDSERIGRPVNQDDDISPPIPPVLPDSTIQADHDPKDNVSAVDDRASISVEDSMGALSSRVDAAAARIPSGTSHRDSKSSVPSDNLKRSHLEINNIDRVPELSGLFQLSRVVGFRILHGDSLKLVDGELLQALEKTLSQFEDVVSDQQLRSEGDIPWTTLTAAFTDSPFWQPEGHPTEAVDSFSLPRIRLGRRLNNFWKSPAKSLREQLPKAFARASPQRMENWFEEKLLRDCEIREHVMRNANLIVQELEQMVDKLVQGDADEDGLYQHLAGGAWAKTYLTVGVLRFPDYLEPHFVMYRLQLTAWAELNHDELEIKSGIRGVCNSCRFRPRSAFLETFQQKAQDLARAEALAYIHGQHRKKPPIV